VYGSRENLIAVSFKYYLHCFKNKAELQIYNLEHIIYILNGLYPGRNGKMVVFHGKPGDTEDKIIGFHRFKLMLVLNHLMYNYCNLNQ
jgi:hypothetical protein